MFATFADWIAALNLGFISESFDPNFAATVISFESLEKILEKAIKTQDKTVLIVIYNNQNQRRYIGVKLD